MYSVPHGGVEWLRCTAFVLRCTAFVLRCTAFVLRCTAFVSSALLIKFPTLRGHDPKFERAASENENTDVIQWTIRRCRPQDFHAKHRVSYFRIPGVEYPRVPEYLPKQNCGYPLATGTRRVAPLLLYGTILVPTAAVWACTGYRCSPELPR